MHCRFCSCLDYFWRCFCADSGLGASSLTYPLRYWLAEPDEEVAGLHEPRPPVQDYLWFSCAMLSFQGYAQARLPQVHPSALSGGSLGLSCLPIGSDFARIASAGGLLAKRDCGYCPGNAGWAGGLWCRQVSRRLKRPDLRSDQRGAARLRSSHHIFAWASCDWRSMNFIRSGWWSKLHVYSRSNAFEMSMFESCCRPPSCLP